jgi:hypothetical protein
MPVHLSGMYNKTTFKATCPQIHDFFLLKILKMYFKNQKKAINTLSMAFAYYVKQRLQDAKITLTTLVTQ